MTDSVERGFQLASPEPGTLAVEGLLTFYTAAAALHAIREAVSKSPVQQLDLAGVRHADSAGLACVLAVAGEADSRGQPIKVLRMPGGMRALAQVCEVDGLLR